MMTDNALFFLLIQQLTNSSQILPATSAPIKKKWMMSPWTVGNDPCVISYNSIFFLFPVGIINKDIKKKRQK